MPIRFERHQKIARYLDPRTGYQETTIACEIRRDPLTGRSGRVAHGLGFHIHPLDIAPLLAASEPSCPFCPDRLFKVTPKFPSEIVPEGRLKLGEAVLFPNLVPYDEHSAVTVMSQEHYVPLGEFHTTPTLSCFPCQPGLSAICPAAPTDSLSPRLLELFSRLRRNPNPSPPAGPRLPIRLAIPSKRN